MYLCFVKELLTYTIVISFNNSALFRYFKIPMSFFFLDLTGISTLKLLYFCGN